LHSPIPATLWYHDHALGITRLNVYAAGAGFYLIRTPDDGETGLLNGVLPGPAPKLGEDPNGNPSVRKSIREIPIAIQPKAFNVDGSQFYPADRAFFEGLGDGSTFGQNTGLDLPFIPDPASDIHAVWNPEAFFNTMVVNGKTWPYLDVAPERYRFRLVNAGDSRFLNLSLKYKDPTTGDEVEIPFYQIGADQGTLPHVVRVQTGVATPLPGDGTIPDDVPVDPDRALLMAPSERADVIVDFSTVPEGANVIMYNTGPDTPFGGFPDIPANAETTGQVMQFRVRKETDTSTPIESLQLDSNPGGVALLDDADVTGIQDLALLEAESSLICVDENHRIQIPGFTPPDCGLGEAFGPKAALLGIDGANGGVPLLWEDPISENPKVGDVQEWQLWNWSADAHPIHLHLVKFQIVGRSTVNAPMTMLPPQSTETGWKDTVIAYPQEVTHIRAKFDVPGLYVWHCHILVRMETDVEVGSPRFGSPLDAAL